MSRLLPLLAAVLATPALARDARPSWAEQIAAHGGPAAILCGQAGVLARVGGADVWLSRHPADWCYADAHGDVVWFGDARKRQVLALDLLGDADATVVVKGALPRFAIYWRNTPKPIAFLQQFSNDTHWMGLEVDGPRVVVYEGNLAFTLRDGILTRDRKRARIKDATFLRQLAERSARKAPAALPTSPCPIGQPVPGLPPRLPGCDDASLCGRVTASVGSTPLCQVLVRQSCGDTCTARAVLWNAETKRFDSVGGVFPVYNPDTDTLAVGDFADPEWALASDDGQLLLADGALYDRAGKTLHPGLGAGPGGFYGHAPARLTPEEAAARYAEGLAALNACRDGEHFRAGCVAGPLAALRQAAEAGQIDAAYVLGSHLFSSRFMEAGADAKSPTDRADYLDALTWITRAAHAGHPKAKTYLPPEVMAVLLTGEAPQAALPEPFNDFPLPWLLAAARAGKPAARQVQIACTIHVATPDGRALVSSPRVGTLLGRPALFTLEEGGGEGQPPLSLRMELTPSLDAAGALQAGGTASLQVSDATALPHPIAPTATPQITLRASEQKAFDVACTVAPAE